MPFRHVVMFKWVDGVDSSRVEAIGRALDTLPGVIDEIRDYRHGPDAGLSGDNFDYVVVADFDDAAGWRAYSDHPTHLAFIADHIKGNVATRSAVQYET